MWSNWCKNWQIFYIRIYWFNAIIVMITLLREIAVVAMLHMIWLFAGFSCAYFATVYGGCTDTLYSEVMKRIDSGETCNGPFLDTNRLDSSSLINYVKSCISTNSFVEIPFKCFQSESYNGVASALGEVLEKNVSAENFQFFVDFNKFFCFTYVRISSNGSETIRLSKCLTKNELARNLFYWLTSQASSKQGFASLISSCYSPKHMCVESVEEHCINELFVNTLVYLLCGSCVIAICIAYMLKRQHFSNKDLADYLMTKCQQVQKCNRLKKSGMIASFHFVQSKTNDDLYCLSFQVFLQRMHHHFRVFNKYRKSLQEILMVCATKLCNIVKRCYQHLKIAHVYCAENKIFYYLADSLVQPHEEVEFNMKEALRKLTLIRAILQARDKKPRKVKRFGRQVLKERCRSKLMSKNEKIFSSDESYRTYEESEESFEVIGTTDDSSSSCTAAKGTESLVSTSLCQNYNETSEHSPKQEDKIEDNLSFPSCSSSSYEVLMLSGSSLQESGIAGPTASINMSFSSSFSKNDQKSYLDSTESRSESFVAISSTSDKDSGNRSEVNNHEVNVIDDQLTESGIQLQFNPTADCNLWPQNVPVPTDVNTFGQTSAANLWEANHNQTSNEPTWYGASIANQNINEDNCYGTSRLLSENKNGTSTGLNNNVWSNVDKSGRQDVWNTSCDAATASSPKKSFITESSFNFDDPRFDSSYSPESNYQVLNQNLRHYIPSFSSHEHNRILCDYSHILNAAGQTETDVNRSAQHIQPLSPLETSKFFAFDLNKTSHLATSSIENHDFKEKSKHKFSLHRKKRNKEKPLNNLQKALELLKRQRDLIDNLRVQLARDAVIISEYQEVLEEVGKDKAARCDAIYKRSLERLQRKQAEEVQRYNQALEAGIVRLYNLQRQRKDAYLREFEARTRLQWKTVEVG